MPLYEWECSKCGSASEIRRTMGERAKPPGRCESCGAQCRDCWKPVLSTPAVARLKRGGTRRFHRHEKA